MSRVGKNPILIPSGVEVAIDGGAITVKGPKGELSRQVPEEVSFSQEGDQLLATRNGEERRHRALHGLYRTLVANMVAGVHTEFTKELEIVGVGYRAQAKGSDAIELALGYSHPVNVKAPEGISFEVPAPTKVVVKGIDKERVGQVAADIRELRKPEPYKGKGVRYAGERIIRKAGKAAK